MPVTPYPPIDTDVSDPPNRGQAQAVFSPKMDAMLGALQPLVDEQNALGAWMNSTADQTEAWASEAEDSATEAAASEAAAAAERITAQAAAAAAEQAAGLTPDPDFGMVISTQAILNLKTATFTAVVGETYRIDTSAGGFDFYPPAGMTQGQVFHIIDHAGTFDINSPRLVAGSYKIMGETIDLILTQKNQRRTFEYAGATKGLEF